MIKFHNVYQVLCFKTMAHVDTVMLLFKELKGFTAKSYMAACQPKGPHQRPAFLPQKDNGIDGSSDGVTNDLILSETFSSMCSC